MTQLSTFVLVTGLTGAGRGTAAKTLEKLGYYVVDNLPAAMIPDAVAAIESASVDRLAVVVDSRSGAFFAGLLDALEVLRDRGLHAKILYLEAADEVLVRRQEAARRPHPLSLEGRLVGVVVGIGHEAERVADLDPVALEGVHVFAVLRRDQLLEVFLPVRVGIVFKDPEGGFAVSCRLREAEFVVQLGLGESEISVFEVGGGGCGNGEQTLHQPRENETSNEQAVRGNHDHAPVFYPTKGSS